MLKRSFMAKARSATWIAPSLLLAGLLAAPAGVRGETAQGDSAPVRPPLIVGVAIDETGITQGDLHRSQDLILALLEVLPRGSQMMVASFREDKRIVLPPTSERTHLAEALASFTAGASGVALPDGLFDIVEYLSSREAGLRALLLVSAG